MIDQPGVTSIVYRQVLQLARKVGLGPLVKRIGTVSASLLSRLRAWRQLRSATRHAPVIINGACDIRLVLYPWKRSQISHLLSREHEEPEARALSLLVRPGDVVVDVGAHIGIFTVLASRAVGLNGVVFAFEPVPETYWLLCETLALNRCENVVRVQKAVTDRVGEIEMNLFDLRHSSWNTMGRPIMRDSAEVFSPTKSIIAPSETLDQFCKANDIRHINFLKVDVEGFEKLVFLGARELLSSKLIDFICFEISQDPLKGADIEAREVFEVLESCGYRSYEFHLDRLDFTGPVRDSNEYWANYYASWRDFSDLNSRCPIGENVDAVP